MSVVTSRIHTAVTVHTIRAHVHWRTNDVSVLLGYGNHLSDKLWLLLQNRNRLRLHHGALTHHGNRLNLHVRALV